MKGWLNRFQNELRDVLVFVGGVVSHSGSSWFAIMRFIGKIILATTSALRNE